MKIDIDDTLDTTRAASTFAALGSEQRLNVLRALVRAGPDGLAIGDLGERTGVTGSTLTHHMKILSAAGLVDQKRDGRRIICVGVDFARIESLTRFLLKECCADSDTPHGQGTHHG